jgi:hypothetical protein
LPTAGEVIQNALIELGVHQANETMSATDAQFGLGKLNRLLSQWSTRSVNIWTILSQRFTLSPSQVSYTIGPTGADFTAARPLGPGPGKGIRNANIVLTSVTPEVHCPLAIWDADQWANIRVNEIPTSLPIGLYNDGAYLNSTLYLWGYPTEANDLELFTYQQLTEFASISGTFEFPPGYEEALTLSLAESLGPPYGAAISEDLRTNARRARAAIQSINTAPPLLQTDDGGLPSSPGGNIGWFNYRSGSPYPGGR